MSDPKEEAQNMRLNTAAVMAHWALHLIDAGYAPAVVIGIKPNNAGHTDIVVFAPNEPLDEVAAVIGAALHKVASEYRASLPPQGEAK